LLRRSLPEFQVRTVQEEGWGAFRNGELLRRAQGNFDVLLTADRRMRYQQKLDAYGIGVVVIITPRLQLPVLERAVDLLRQALATVQTGEVLHVTVPAAPQNSE